MKKFLGLMIISVLLLSLVGCASLNAPVSATSNEVGSLVGQSTGTIWFMIFGNADAGIQKACQNGGITKISTVDFETKMVVLGLGTQYTCTVTGE